MSQLVVSTLDVPELSDAALDLLIAAVRHAYENQEVKLHRINIDEFCRLTDLSATTTERFSALLKEARKALLVVEVIDTLLPERDDLPYSSWPIFNIVGTDGSNFIFEVCNDTFGELERKRLRIRSLSDFRGKNGQRIPYARRVG